MTSRLSSRDRVAEWRIRSMSSLMSTTFNLSTYAGNGFQGPNL